jgi:hypothetical protein
VDCKSSGEGRPIDKVLFFVTEMTVICTNGKQIGIEIRIISFPVSGGHVDLRQDVGQGSSATSPTTGPRRTVADSPSEAPSINTSFYRAVSNRADYRALKAAANMDDFRLLMLAGGNASVVDMDGAPAHHFSHRQVVDFLHCYDGSQKICFNGTARDYALPMGTKLWIPKLVAPLVADGVGMSCGGAVTGAMGWAILCYQGAIAEYEEKHGPCDAEIANVLLKLYGDLASYETPMDVGRCGQVLEKQRGWMLRTPLLHAVGQQSVLLYVEGGLGTLFEVYSPATNQQIRNRGPVGPFDCRKGYTEIIFASSTTSRGETFWAPTARQFEEIVRCGVGKSEHYAPFVVAVDGPEADECVSFIQSLYRDARHSPPPVRERLDPQERAVQADVFHRLHDNGFGLYPYGASEKAFLALLDNMVAAQRIVYHRRNYMELWRRGEKNQAESYLNKIERIGPAERSEVLGTIKRLADKPAIYFIGSAKLGSEKAFHDHRLEEYSREVIRSAVEKGSSIVIDGKGTEGMPARWSAIWAEEMVAFEARTASRSTSELVRVQLAYKDEEVPARELAPGYTETVLPSVLTFEVRTALAGSIGGKRAVVLAPDGPGLSAFTQLLLDSQLAGSIDGCYATKEERPVFQVLNIPGAAGRGPFYAPFLEQLKVMEEGKTINAGDYDSRWFDSLEDPKASARALIEAHAL